MTTTAALTDRQAARLDQLEAHHASHGSTGVSKSARRTRAEWHGLRAAAGMPDISGLAPEQQRRIAAGEEPAPLGRVSPQDLLDGCGDWRGGRRNGWDDHRAQPATYCTGRIGCECLHCAG